MILNSVQLKEQLLLLTCKQDHSADHNGKDPRKTETETADEQVKFQQRRETRDQITNLRILMHNAHKQKQPLYMWFVDFKKVFDPISYDKLWVTMMDMGYPLHLSDLLAKLYKKTAG